MTNHQQAAILSGRSVILQWGFSPLVLDLPVFLLDWPFGSGPQSPHTKGSVWQAVTGEGPPGAGAGREQHQHQLRV